MDQQGVDELVLHQRRNDIVPLVPQLAYNARNVQILIVVQREQQQIRR